MRRRVIAVTVLVTAALALAGCAKPAGVDGNLVNGWALPAEPKIPVPTAPACYDGDAAQRTSPPPSGGPDRRTAFGLCSTQAKDYLGGDWRTGRMELFLVLPSELHWDAGARWYRCDIVEYRDLEDFAVVDRNGSMKGGLLGASDLKLGCATVTASGDSIDKVLPIACSTAHNGEFTGVYDHPDGEYPTDATARSKANLDGCRAVVAAYTGVPNDKDFQYRAGQVASPFSKAAWEIGNRGVRCYVWTPKTFTTSLKGAGVGGLPINYA